MQDKNFQTEVSQEEKSYWTKLYAQKEKVMAYSAGLNDGSPAVYVGTYAKYNDGNLFGEWIDLKSCYDYEEFIEVCHQLHADEEDPELMLQDFEGFPSLWYSESCMDESTFDKIKEYADMDDKEAFDAYVSSKGDDDIERFRDCCMGKYESKEDFAYEMVDELYNLDEHGVIGLYFDYKAYAYDLFHESYTFEDGYVFSDC